MVEALPEVSSFWQGTLPGIPLTIRLDLPGLTGIFPHHRCELTTRWWSVDCSASPITWVFRTLAANPTTRLQKCPGCKCTCGHLYAWKWCYGQSVTSTEVQQQNTTRVRHPGGWGVKVQAPDPRHRAPPRGLAPAGALVSHVRLWETWSISVFHHKGSCECIAVWLIWPVIYIFFCLFVFCLIFLITFSRFWSLLWL